MPIILHFADAHIDMANYGRHDPDTGLPLRVLDFLKSLDTIVEAAITEKVDLVIFAGDAYKDRSPAPTFQREWGRRIIRLSKAGIRTLLLVGNHDLSPAAGRANAIQEFETLDIPHVTVLARPQFLSAEELGLPAQVIALPWISRSGLLAAVEDNPVVDATSELARVLLAQDVTADPNEPGLRSVRIEGTLSVDYDVRKRVAAVPAYVRTMLMRFGEYLGPRGALVRLTRV